MSASRWTDDELISLQNAYDRDVNGHDDVVTLIRGARAVIALCARGGYVEADSVLLALNLEV